jgi:hypothetical protein
MLTLAPPCLQPAKQRTNQLVGRMAIALSIGAMAGGVVAQGSPAAPAATAVAVSSDWQDLSAAQQSTLKPLAQRWQTMSPDQKRKWLELSKNYSSMTPAEQAMLQERMAGWATLSPEQRALARQNFAQHRALTRGLTPEQRKAQWQAYELLSPEEKQKLAASSQKPLIGAAIEINPSNPLKNSAPPQFGTAQVLGQAQQQQGQALGAGKIAVQPHMRKGNSLMAPAAVADAANPAASATKP